MLFSLFFITYKVVAILFYTLLGPWHLVTVPLSETFYRRETDVQTGGMTWLELFGKSVVKQIIYQIPTSCLTIKSVPLLPFFCVSFPPSFLVCFSQAHSCALHSLLLASWSTWFPCPAPILYPLISHGFPCAPSITLTAVTVVDHHSNSTVVLGWTQKKWVIVAPAEATYMYKQEESFGRAMDRFFWFIQWIEADMADLQDLAHHGQSS